MTVDWTLGKDFLKLAGKGRKCWKQEWSSLPTIFLHLKSIEDRDDHLAVFLVNFVVCKCFQFSLVEVSFSKAIN